MTRESRRRFLKQLGLAGVASTTVGSGTALADNHEGQSNGEENRRTRGRIDPLGHELQEGSPVYTFGDVNEDGTWGVISNWVGFGSTTTSTLYDLSDPETPEEVHRVSTAVGADSNHVRFDGTRNGLYYRALERSDVDGVEVIDFGWGDGTPEDPEIIARAETPNTGVHALCAHPDAEVMYLVDEDPSEPGVIPMDVSNPTEPKLADLAGPNGYCHAVEADSGRGVLHCAFIFGEFVGYSILDIGDDPLAPEEIGSFDYDDAPDYEEVGEEGFESCHHAHFDPERDLAVVGDEVAAGIPGGKHIFDIGWDEGSLEDPIPLGFVTSPDAREMAPGEFFWWTTHFHDVVPTGDETLLIDGGYRNGAWVANITDPENPTATERYATDEDADIAGGGGLFPEDPPFAWGAVYNEERDFVFVSDTLTGAYTFDVSALPARGKDEGGPANYYDVDDIVSDDDVDSDRQIFAPLTHGQSQQESERSGSTGVVTLEEQDNGMLSFELTAKNIEGVTQAHVHGRADRDDTADVVAPLVIYTENIDGSEGDPEDGPVEETGTIGADVASDILADPGQYYVNVHTVNNVAGEIRGQLRVRYSDPSEMR
jgi:hypothetical protein